MNIADIISEYGAYYKQSGQNLQSLFRQIMAKSETEVLFQRRVLTDTRIEGSPVNMGPVLQAFQKKFTAFGNAEFLANIIYLDHIKVDVEESPDDLEATWLGFLSDDESQSRAQWPFVKYWIQQLIIPKMAEDWELSGIFHGKKKPVVDGTPLPIGDAVDGIKTIRNRHIQEGKTDVIMVGEVPEDAVDFVEYIETFVDRIPSTIRPFLQNIAMSNTLESRYKTGMRKKYNSNYQQAQLAEVIDRNMTVQGFTSHEGSDVLWTTVKGNSVLGVKKPSNENGFKIEEAKRQVSAMTDFWKGIGFWRPDYLFTNDVELT